MERWSEHQYAREVRSKSDFAEFVKVLRETERKPVMAISIAEDRSVPDVDVAALEQQLDDSVYFYVLPAQVTFWLTDELGDKSLSVHSGWVRVYPSARSWLDDPHLSPKFPPMPSNPRRAVERIVEAALTVAFKDGHTSVDVVSVSGVRTAVRVRDVVSATQAMVADESGRRAILRTHYLVRGLPAERVVTRGQWFIGVLKPVGLFGEFVPDHVRDDAYGRAVEFVGEGLVTAALASKVSRRDLSLLLHPDVSVHVSAGTDEDLTTEVTEGEVVTIEIVRIDGEFIVSFSNDEPQPAMSVLPSGPPWILPEVASPAPEMFHIPLGDGEPEVVGDAGVGNGRSDELLIGEMEMLLEALSSAEETIKQLRRQLRRSNSFKVPAVYIDPDEQFRFELKVSYLTRVEQASRGDLPWPERFKIGPVFLQSVDDLVRGGGITREKIVEICSEVLCGRARDLPSRAVKEWRTSRQGPQLVRPSDGAVAMRVRLQTATSAARRLRYWKLPSGEIELDRVVVHDAGI